MNNSDNLDPGAAADGLTSPGVRPHEVPADDLLVVAAELIQAASRARDGDREATRAHIAHAVALLGRQSSPAPDLPSDCARGGLLKWQMRRVFVHVEANLSRKITIRELAVLLGLSASHFCRAFRRTLGISPRDYLLHRRIELAQRLMLTTSESLSSIAIQCGMCDQPHFTRSFHRLVGETPNKWRRIRQGAQPTN